MNKIPKMVTYAEFLKIKDLKKDRPLIFVSDAEWQKWRKGMKKATESEMKQNVGCKLRLAPLPGYGGFLILWSHCPKNWEERWIETPAGRIRVCVPRKSRFPELTGCGLLFSDKGISCAGLCKPDRFGILRRCQFVYRDLGFFCGYDIGCVCRGRIPIPPRRPRKTVNKPS